MLLTTIGLGGGGGGGETYNMIIFFEMKKIVNKNN